jgi:hypothetical protein
MIQDRVARVEQKFLFPAGYADVIRSWLEHACVADPRYPHSSVCSIYFDTPGLFHYGESRNGEFLRSKVRLRWYGGMAGGSAAAGSSDDVRCFLEVKSKQGSLSAKSRTEVSIPSRILQGDPFSSDRILDLPARAFQLSFTPSGPMVPILMIEYDRRRFLDLETECGVALDGEIRCIRVNHAVVPGLAPVHLDVGVLEIKGMNRGIGDLLNPIQGFLKTSPFSKYGIVLESLMQPLGRRV